MATATANPEPETHPLFPRSTETDLTIRSSDEILFHLERKSMETHAGAPPEFRKEVDVAEPSRVLGVLFQFVGLRKQPNLKEQTFEEIVEIAEAAEKFKLYSAMNFCQLRMRQHLPSQALPILLYAIKHDYPELVNEVAPCVVVNTPLLDVIEQLPDEYIRPWNRYHSAWNNAFSFDPNLRAGSLCRWCTGHNYLSQFKAGSVKGGAELDSTLAQFKIKGDISARPIRGQKVPCDDKRYSFLGSGCQEENCFQKKAYTDIMQVLHPTFVKYFNKA